VTQLAVLGSPIGHALSPVLHRAAYQELGLDWDYHALDCTPDRLATFLAGLDDSWAGLSLTMPLKRTAIPLLDEVTPRVRATGTANTVTIHHGQLQGENTDIDGMLRALLDAGITRVDSACVLGTGATAATALAVLAALGCREVTAIVRDPARAGELARAAERIGIALRLQSWADAGRHLGADLIVSALPPGAADPLAPQWPAAENTLLDVVYRPWPTMLAQAARRAGSTVIGGLPMLVHQAARQAELQTGRPAPLAAMWKAAQGALNEHTPGT
jgi:shikimate dehydrogenase